MLENRLLQHMALLILNSDHQLRFNLLHLTKEKNQSRSFTNKIANQESSDRTIAEMHKGMKLMRLPGLLTPRTYSKLTQVDFQVELDIQDSLQ